MRRVRGVVHGQAWGLSPPRKGIRSVAKGPCLALLRSGYSLFTAARRVHRLSAG
jgi:hypothetical protein